MTRFPDGPDYAGLNSPIGDEYELSNLTVEGRIPDDVQGVFFRAVPDPAFPPFMEDGGAVLSGDGMVSAIRLGAGRADFAIRYVHHRSVIRQKLPRGARYSANIVIRYTDKPEAANLDRTVANTTPVWHAGRLLMAKEDGRPYRVDPRTLETLGSYDFAGKLKSQTMTAHVRIDPRHRRDVLLRLRSGWSRLDQGRLLRGGPRGQLVSEQWFDAPYCAMMHDFAITKNYALFPIYPTTCDAQRVKAGGDHWVHEMDRDSWVGVMPRDGTVDELRWFRGPRACPATT